MGGFQNVTGGDAVGNVIRFLSLSVRLFFMRYQMEKHTGYVATCNEYARQDRAAALHHHKKAEMYRQELEKLHQRAEMARMQ